MARVSSIYSVDTLDKEMIYVLGGQSKIVQDFIKPLKMAYNFKPMNCYFWKFPFNIFRPRLIIPETTENETTDMGGLYSAEREENNKQLHV
jgi:hypothetical protein